MASQTDAKKSKKKMFNINSRQRLNDQQRKQMQHEFKIYMEKYFKQKLGKGVDKTRIIIWEDAYHSG